MKHENNTTRKNNVFPPCCGGPKIIPEPDARLKQSHKEKAIYQCRCKIRTICKNCQVMLWREWRVEITPKDIPHIDGFALQRKAGRYIQPYEAHHRLCQKRLPSYTIT